MGGAEDVGATPLPDEQSAVLARLRHAVLHIPGCTEAFKEQLQHAEEHMRYLRNCVMLQARLTGVSEHVMVAPVEQADAAQHLSDQDALDDSAYVNGVRGEYITSSKVH